jgi:hypothetical protein
MSLIKILPSLISNLIYTVNNKSIDETHYNFVNAINVDILKIGIKAATKNFVKYQL